jgi:hypothetical protein
MPDLIRVRLRPVRETDLVVLEEAHSRETNSWNWFQ